MLYILSFSIPPIRALLHNFSSLVPSPQSLLHDPLSTIAPLQSLLLVLSSTLPTCSRMRKTSEMDDLWVDWLLCFGFVLQYLPFDNVSMCCNLSLHHSIEWTFDVCVIRFLARTHRNTTFGLRKNESKWCTGYFLVVVFRN